MKRSFSIFRPSARWTGCVQLILSIGLTLTLMAGCAAHRPVMPTMDLPPEPVRPKITWTVIQHQNEPYIGLKMADGLALWEYLIRLDALGQQYRGRIDAMNKLLGEK